MRVGNAFERSGVATALLLTVPLSLGTAAAVWGLAISPLESNSSEKPVIASVGSAQRTDATRATATYIPAEAFPVTTRSAGTITNLSIAVGVPVDNATMAMKVDGNPVFAYVAAAPLYRDIARGLTGDDVTTAQQLLHDLGYLDDVDGKAGYGSERAIKAFNKDQGYGDDNPVLAASALLWIPQGSGAPQTVSVRVGATLTPGAELYVATAGEARFDLEIVGTEQDRVVTAGDVVVALAPGQTQISDPGSVASLKQALGDASTLSVSIALAEPRTVGTLPASAIVSDADGTTCFFRGVDSDAVLIDSETGSMGVVDVDASLIGDPVLVNPREVKDAPACAS